MANRFEVVALENGRYGVVDTFNGKRVFYSYSNPPNYGTGALFSEWNNWYSANGFAQKLTWINS